MSTALRPMTTGEVLDRTFNLYRNNFALFAGIAVLPPALNLGMSVMQMITLGTTPNPAQLMANGIGFLLLALVYIVGAVLAAAATVHAVSMVHLGKPTTIGNSYRGIQPHIGRLLLLVVLITLIMIVIFSPSIILFIMGVTSPGSASVFLGLASLLMLVSIVLAVHFYARYSLSMAACVLEKVTAVASMRRSLSLTKGASGRIWLIFILTGIIGAALVLAAQAPVLVLLRNGTLTLMTGRIILAIEQFFAATIAGPIATISLVLVYYDQRVRKEAFDLQVMMEALGQSGPEQAISAAPIG